ncbi:hypothetical protein BGZ75_002500 [Mortierella antarctica]|nr:hypothetical protein BGZ75_002500 [Mortierella antarctica]
MAIRAAQSSFFAIPELIVLVSAHLLRSDLAQCIKVCRDWWHLLEPVLWANFRPQIHHNESLSAIPPPSLKAALIRNLHHIRTLKVPIVNDNLLQVLTTTDASTRCTGLKRLEFEDISWRDFDLTCQYLVTLLDLNHRLTCLKLPFKFLEIDAVRASMSKLERLQHLSIHSTAEFDGDWIVTLVLQACLPLPYLNELFIDTDVDWCEYDNEHTPFLKTIIKEASIARFSRNPNATRIKSLRLPSNFDGKRNPLPLLLLKSDLLDLVSCELPWFHKDTDLDELERVVREQCPNLKHLTCPSFSGRDEDGQAACAFIRGCSGLQSFASHLFSDHDRHSHFAEPRCIISELASQHCNTLEDFVLTNALKVFSRDQQAILSRCKQLRRFWVMGYSSPDCSIGVEFMDICSREWVCEDLTTLGLTLNRWRRRGIVFQDLEEEDVEERDETQEDVEKRLMAIAPKGTFAQIGRLERLEVLALDIDSSWDTRAEESDYAWDLTLSKGYLGELASLKNLKSLSLRADFWSKMGQAEPILWTNFRPKKHLDDALSDASLMTALIMNLPHIRTIEGSVASATLLHVLINGSDTESAHFVPISSDSTFRTLAAIRSPSYHSIWLSCSTSTPRLTHLRLLFNFFEFEASDDDRYMPDLKTIIQEALITRFSQHPNATKIKFLRLPSTQFYNRNPPPILFLKSDLLDLKSCEIPWFQADTDIQEIERVVREHCPNLKHLTCSSFDNRGQNGQTVCAFIRGRTGLQSVTSELFTDHDAYYAKPWSIISELASQHRNTLEDFALTNCCQVSSPC